MISKQEEDQLNLLGILSSILYAGFVGLMGALFAGMAILPADPAPHGSSAARAGDPPTWVMGGIYLGIFGFVALLFLAKAVAMIFAGRAMSRRTNHTLCMVGASGGHEHASRHRPRYLHDRPLAKAGGEGAVRRL